MTAEIRDTLIIKLHHQESRSSTMQKQEQVGENVCNYTNKSL